MSKRKAPESKSQGKRPATDLGDDATDEQLSNLLGDDDTGLDDETGDLEALIDGVDGDAPEDASDLLPLHTEDSVTEAPPDDEVGELPDGLDESQLVESAEVDLSKFALTLPQARCVARHLARNSGLETVRFEDHSLPVGDMKESEELEWDSEEYTDVDAIVIAELMKSNSSVQRLDLARNGVGDAGAMALASMLSENSTLEYLNLESNTFGERGGVAFCTALASNTCVQYLNLMYNSVPTAVQDRIRGAWTHGVGLHL